MYKYDYTKNTFKTTVVDGNKVYMMFVKDRYIEVPKDVYNVCHRSYNNACNEQKRNKEKFCCFKDEVEYNTDIKAIIDLIYIKDLHEVVIQSINELPDEYRDIARCIFIEELSVRDTAKKLKVPKSTISDRKAIVIKIFKKKFKYDTDF